MLFWSFHVHSNPESLVLSSIYLTASRVHSEYVWAAANQKTAAFATLVAHTCSASHSHTDSLFTGYIANDALSVSLSLSPTEREAHLSSATLIQPEDFCMLKLDNLLATHGPCNTEIE